MKKSDRTLKVRAHANGRKQREFTDKTDAALLTAILESIFIAAAIDAKEYQNVAIMDLLEAFLYVCNDEKVIMIMKGKMAELMAHAAFQMHRKYITMTKVGEYIIYESAEGIVWNTNECTSVLQQAVAGP